MCTYIYLYVYIFISIYLYIYIYAAVTNGKKKTVLCRLSDFWRRNYWKLSV